MSRRQYIFDEICDHVGRFVYYDRKEDESLPRGALQQAIAAGEITLDEIISAFEFRLRGALT